MTVSMNLGKGYKLMFSDRTFAYARKKPTISVYDEENNIEQKIASFNNQESFEWFCREVLKVEDNNADGK